jgi:GST-like protein
MACYPWISPERQGQDMDQFPHLKRWKARIKKRPAVQRAYEIAKIVNATPTVNDAASREVLFGQDQSTVK